MSFVIFDFDFLPRLFVKVFMFSYDCSLLLVVTRLVSVCCIALLKKYLITIITKILCIVGCKY